jgi:hypothetical protein
MWEAGYLVIRVQGVFRSGNIDTFQIGVDDSAFGGVWTGPATRRRNILPKRGVSP